MILVNPEWVSRAPKLLPRNPRDPNSVKDVYMIVSAHDYTFWSFFEEMKRYGVSKRVSRNFPVEELTAGKSRMRLIFPYGVPKFNFDVDLQVSHYDKCKVYWKMQDVTTDEDWPPSPGHHPVIDAKSQSKEDLNLEQKVFSFCTYAHKDLDALLLWDNVYATKKGNTYLEIPDDPNSGLLEVFFPSIDNHSLSWIANDVSVPGEDLESQIQFVQDKKNWIPAIGLDIPIGHIEFIKQETSKFRQNANRAGYQTFVVEE